MVEGSIKRLYAPLGSRSLYIRIPGVKPILWYSICVIYFGFSDLREDFFHKQYHLHTCSGFPSVGRSPQVKKVGPRRLFRTSKSDACGCCGPASSAVAGDPTPCSTLGLRAPRQLLRAKKRSGVGQQVREQTRRAAADHLPAEEASEGAAGADLTAEGRAERGGAGAGAGENCTAHTASNDSRIQTKEQPL